MSRREFTKSVKVQIIKRATTIEGQVRCENPFCRAFVTRWEINHRHMDAMSVDKSRKLDLLDGELLCIDCHKAVTKAQAPVLAKVLRVEAKHLGARRDKQPIKSDPSALKSRRRPPHEGREPVPRREMFVSLGEAASGVLAKLNPKKAAE